MVPLGAAGDALGPSPGPGMPAFPGPWWEGRDSRRQDMADVGSWLGLGHKRAKETNMSLDPCL